jgi:hypothetical protein
MYLDVSYGEIRFEDITSIELYRMAKFGINCIESSGFYIIALILHIQSVKREHCVEAISFGHRYDHIPKPGVYI